MNWKFSLLVVAAAIVAVTLRGESTLPADAARKQLLAGALLVDVRTAEEFKAKSLPGAVNIPVDAIKTGITNHAPDKSKVVLLHCKSGRRSAIAERELRAMGYTNAFSIGSFEQAQKIVEPAAK